MKNLFRMVLMCCVCLYSYVSTAQTYTPFPTENAVWYDQILVTGLYSNPYYTNVYGFQGDTTINSLNYTKVYGVQDTVFNVAHETAFYKGALREADKQIFFIESGTDEEYILYDFNVQVGDTLSINYHLSTNTLIIADIVQATLLNGEIRTKFVLEVHTDTDGIIDIFPAYDIWEGMGGTRGLFYDKYWATAQDEFPNDSIIEYLRCHHLNGETLFDNTGNEDCYFNDVETAVKDISIASSYFIYPNPGQNEVTIELKTSLFAMYPDKVLVYNTLGQLIIEEKWMPYTLSQNIDISTLVPSIYSVILVKDGQILGNQQLIKKRK